MSHDVFISYSTKDAKIADAVCHALESSGIRCWYAPRDIRSGSHWPSAIMNAISSSRVMVYIWSSNANLSADVTREVQHAFRKERTLIPFRVENVRPTQELEYYLESVHWLDALTPPLEAHIQRLTEHVKACLLHAQSPVDEEKAEEKKNRTVDPFRKDAQESSLPLLAFDIDAYGKDMLVKTARSPRFRNSVIDSLIEAARKREDPAERYWIYVALGEIGGKRAERAIFEGLSDPDELARTGANWAWAAMGLSTDDAPADKESLM